MPSLPLVWDADSVIVIRLCSLYRVVHIRSFVRSFVRLFVRSFIGWFTDSLASLFIYTTLDPYALVLFLSLRAHSPL